MIGINIAQFAILTSETPKQGEPIDIKTDLQFSATSDCHIVVVQTRFEYFHNNVQLLVLEIHCRFAIDKKSCKVFSKEEQIVIPKDFLAHLAMHAVGTARGILFCKTEGTPLNTVILPPINVAAMITKDFIANK